MPASAYIGLCGNARKRKIVRGTIAPVNNVNGSRMTSISLHGRVPVKPAALKALSKLVDLLEPDSDDVVAIEDDVLNVQIGNCDAPRGFHQTACQAISAFCEKYATAGAVFDFDGSTLVVGPDGQAKKNAHAAHLLARIEALTGELKGVLAS